MKKVVIVIPIYRNELTELEKVSLQQAKDVLGQYDMVFIAPDDLPVSLVYQYEHILIYRFAARYFVNTASYSELLLSAGFYQRFIKYEYMLIYQLDAFVFSERLREFCSLGFDYIGAVCKGKYWDEIHCQVGNGGFSLRKISSCLRMVQDKERVFDAYPELISAFNQYEDLFFSVCQNIREADFKVADVDTARSFSAQYEICDKEELPFGCHGWFTYNYFAWYSLLVSLYKDKYLLPEPNKIEYLELSRLDAVLKCFKDIENRFTAADESFCQRAQEIFHTTCFSVWGFGDLGKKLCDLLWQNNVQVAGVYDRNLQVMPDKRIKIRQPSSQNLLGDRGIIIIGTVKDQIIQQKLLSLGKEQNKNFYLLDDFLLNFVV